MDIQLVPVLEFQNFLFCLARVLSFIVAIPVFAGNQMSIQLRIGIAVATALIVFPLMSPHIPQSVFNFTDFGVLIVNEFILGAILALIGQLVFASVSLGGTIIGYQMGFAAANVFDPQTTQQLSLMSQFQNVLAILFFLALDIHHLYFQAIVESYILLPPGYLNLSGQAVPKLMELGSHMFVLGIKFSAPVIAMLLLSNLALGILARVFPQLNVFMLSFPKNIGIGLLVIGLTLGATATILRQEFDLLGFNLFEILQYLRP